MDKQWEFDKFHEDSYRKPTFTLLIKENIPNLLLKQNNTKNRASQKRRDKQIQELSKKLQQGLVQH